MEINKQFFFQSVSEETVKDIAKNLPSNKVTAGEISLDILKVAEFCFSKNISI